MTGKQRTLRSARWFEQDSIRGFAHRQRSLQMGYRREDFMGKPVVGIINTHSDLATCHQHLRQRAEDVKRGVLRAGGFPVELPTFSLGEVLVKPTTMLYRNLLAIETEELLRAHPIDAAVLLGGCDKTTPGLIMGATSADIPAVFIPAGPMMSGSFKGRAVGAGTHTKKYWDERRKGEITENDWLDLETAMTRSPGTCQTMGTASTMTCIVEAMGLALPGAASIPAVDSAHPRMAAQAGEVATRLALHGLPLSELLTEAHFNNAAVALMALGGSTNAAIHLIAMARRAGLTKYKLTDLVAAGKGVPVLADLFPHGSHMMQDFHDAGGMRALLSRVREWLDLDTIGVDGNSLRSAIEGAQVWNDEVIRPVDNPVTERPALAVVKGSLAPGGAVIKPSSASAELMKHEGRAVVFDGPADMAARIDHENISKDDVLVLRGGGPVGAPGMPEWGNLPIPKPLLEKGVKDIVRISDSRMSGTHYGTCILHVSPESAVGGPLALIETGDRIALDVESGRLDLLVDDNELSARREKWQPPEAPSRGWSALYVAHVGQAEDGCDFDFLLADGRPVQEPEIF
ncbi:IlvD/Edd family dehydratase [Ahrensia marina]|uniref:Dihydroxy-acid dehydratase n=1 Tax=Ahrensia marina TaxID=1514904 RepID=A0A0M9GP37_9HYPH|nr:IlvD/Edd family dehydratase [Ahrensia marina]KPB02340.1 dihydroxy-acid dehydratase [Ahrensia marina]